MSNIIRKIVPVSELRKGDTVEIDGVLETVNGERIRYCGFMGWTYQGSPFLKGITKIIFKVHTINGYVYR
tara:strand:- start:1045 stop:1254 length:210 start_codon:yes stop_codon:yes gene_type:complete